MRSHTMGLSMLRRASRAAALIIVLILSFRIYAQESGAKQLDNYYVLLHSRSLAVQRKALKAVIKDPKRYVPRLQQSLQDYPRLLRTDPLAADRAVYLSALLRDPSFPGLLVKNIGNETVLNDCIYACPLVFALTVQASFAGWKPPSSLDPQLETVSDLRNGISSVSHLNLKVGRIDDLVQGPWLEEHRKEIEGKTEEQLIQMAGPANSSADTRQLAADRLETLITDPRNRIELYLLTLNEIRDASGEYRSSIYHAIYRAELAKVRSESAARTH
jgi:hypothetical protein